MVGINPRRRLGQGGKGAQQKEGEGYLAGYRFHGRIITDVGARLARDLATDRLRAVARKARSYNSATSLRIGAAQ
jgi:hypothetical protein